MRQQYSCTGCHAVVTSVNWVAGDPFHQTPDGGDGKEHPYCEHCLPVKTFLDFGTAVIRLPDGQLLCSAMTAAGGWERDNWGDLTAPASQDFLDRVNTKFGAAYRMDQFSGR